MLTLNCTHGHLFVDIDDRPWLVDTGAPSSFGIPDTITLSGRSFPIQDHYFQLDAAALSELVELDCAGLLGNDILGQFDWIFDCAQNSAHCGDNLLMKDGLTISIEHQMTVPVFPTTIAGERHCLFFDTGAQISYLPPKLLAGCPPAGDFTDFYPSLGRFTLPTFWADLSLGSLSLRLRCATLPDALQPLLAMANGVVGILGNEILHQHRLGYFPRQDVVVL